MAATADSTQPKVTLRTIVADPHVRPIIGLVFVLLAGIGVVFPIIPLYARSFGVGYDGVGLLIGAFGFARLLGDLIGGTIVDRKGEKWSALLGMAILAVCSTATGLAPNYFIALISWGLAGIGSAVTMASLFSYILKAAPQGQTARTLSVFFGAFNIGVIAGGGIGGFVAGRFGLASPLFVYAGISLIAMVVYVRFVPPPPSAHVPQDAAAGVPDGHAVEAPLPSKGIVRDLLRLPGFVTTLAVNFTYLWFVAAIFNTLMPLFAQDALGMTPAGIGVVFSIAVAVEFLVLFPAGSFADRYGRKAVMVPSLFALIVMIAVLGLSTTPVMLCVLLSILCLASGFAGVPPAAMLSDVVPSEHSGRGVGAFRFAGDLGFLFGPLIAGASSTAFGFKTAFVLAAIPSVVALVMVMRTAETLKRKETP